MCTKHKAKSYRTGVIFSDSKKVDQKICVNKGIFENRFIYDGIRIDGHLYSPEDAFKLLCPYEGSELHFALRDSSDSEPFTNDTVLYPVEMNIDTFVDELAKIMMVVSDKHEGKFIKKEDVP